MANITMGFSYNVRDSHGVSGLAHVLVNVPDATSLAAVAAAWTALGTLLDAATDGKITSGRITFPQVADDGWKDNAEAASDAAMAGVLQFSAQATLHQQSVVVPALIESAQTSGSVNLNATGLKEFIYGIYHGFGAGNAYKGSNISGGR